LQKAFIAKENDINSAQDRSNQFEEIKETAKLNM